MKLNYFSKSEDYANEVCLKRFYFFLKLNPSQANWLFIPITIFKNKISYYGFTFLLVII